MKKTKYYSIFFILLISTILLFNYVSAEETEITKKDPEVIVEYFYGETCSECAETSDTIDEAAEYFSKNITVYRLLVHGVDYPENLKKMQGYGFQNYPAAVIINTSNNKYDKLYGKDEITLINLKALIGYHLEGNYSKEKPGFTKDTQRCFLGLFCFDTDDYSLPVLTIVLGFLDSLNPCSFFIFLFLLSILLHMQSRKRMLLVAGIFIFFSGFFYFLLMAAMLNVFLVLEYEMIISVVAGCLALVFGSLNIKDFFLSKQGPSLSIAEEKKSKLFKQIRNLSKMSYLPGLIGYTIILAVSVNTVELLCSLGLPLIYVDILTSYKLSSAEYYSYIMIYNVVYVIPLIILVLVFAIILKRWKLTDWQGRLLKLYSGILMFSLGILLIADPTILHHIESFAGLIGISLLITFIISYIMKKQKKKKV